MRIVIADDEGPARARLRALVEECEAGEVVGEARNGEEAVALAQERGAELMLLDIRMPAMDGLEAARHLAALPEPPAVIFTTAYDSHAIEAIEANAVGYLLKPIRRERLAEAIDRAKIPTRAQLANLQSSPALPQSGGRTHVSASFQGNLRLLPVNEVIYFRAEHKYVTARHRDGELVIEDPLTALEEELGPSFIRVHRNALIALRFSRGLRRTREGRTVVVFEGVDDQVEVSRRLISQVRKAIQAFANT